MENTPRFDAPVYAQIKAEKQRMLNAKACEKADAARKTPLAVLTRAFGVFGLALYYALFLAIAYAPLLFLGFPWWANVLIVLAILFLPYAGGLLRLILWVWGFLVVVRLPLSFAVVLFYIGAVLYVVFVLLPRILGCFGIDIT